ncbi:MAG: helix-turn-helix domain-containing protein [Chloroflexota bacterium]|nr:MAG: helix-turn-helix domain-containing protein [Chloroflexota bacterium]
MDATVPRKPSSSEQLVNNNKVLLGRRIKELRRAHHLTLRELAAKAGVTASLVSQIERGLANPSVSTLVSIAYVLEQPVDYLFDTDGRSIGGDADRTADEAPRDDNESANAIGVLADAISELATGNGGSSGVGDPKTSLDSQPTLYQRKLGGLIPVVTPDQRDIIDISGNIQWQRLTPKHDQSVDFLEVRYGVGATTGDALYRHQGREYGVVVQGRLLIELGFNKYVVEPGHSFSFDCGIPHRITNVGDVQAVAIWFILDQY